MKKVYFITTVITLLLIFVSFYSFAQKEIDFHINIEAKACFEVETNLSIVSKNKDKENKSESATLIRYKVVKKTPELYRLNFMYTNYYSTIEAGTREIIIDPKNADALNIFDVSTQVSLMMNKPFSAELSPKGEIRAIKENKEILKELKMRTKELSPELREGVYFVVNSMVDNNALVELIKSWTSYIPVTSVKIGDSWSIRQDSTVTYYTFVLETDSTCVIEGFGSGKKTVPSKIQGMELITMHEEDFSLIIEIDKQTFLPKIITKEIESLNKQEIKNYPIPVPPLQSHTTSKLIIRNCNE
jgi:hypothetical protein